MAAHPDVRLKSTIDESDLTYHEQLGRGASGDVFRVTWKSKHHGKVEAAAKKIPILKDKGIDNEQLRNEIFFLKKLKHSNIIQYYGHIVTLTHVVIVMEYAAKGSLNTYLDRQTRLPAELKARWLLQAARGIQYLKQNNVSHSDIKSENLLITSKSDLKICDFGISTVLFSTEQTEIGKGTIRWQAPEIYTKGARSPSADIFSFGVVAWELETCEVPYKREQPQHTGYGVEHWLRFNISVKGLRPSIPKNCPTTLRELMQQCWDGDRTKRPDIDEVISRLESYESGLRWQLQHQIDTACVCLALHWVSHHHLEVCTWKCVKVYDVTTEARSQLVYTLTSDEWRAVRGVAVSESLPDSMMVISNGNPYVYQYPCHQTGKELKKYTIRRGGRTPFFDFPLFAPVPHGNQIDPWCIAANANTAVIGLVPCKTLVIFSLPHFNHQSHIQISVNPLDVSITSEYLLVMGRTEMLVKPLGDVSQDLCRICRPDGFSEFLYVCFGNNARQIYAGCYQDGRGSVYKYTWNGDGDPHYVNTGCVDSLQGRHPLFKGISLSLYGLLAVVDDTYPKVKVYSLG